MLGTGKADRVRKAKYRDIIIGSVFLTVGFITGVFLFFLPYIAISCFLVSFAFYRDAYKLNKGQKIIEDIAQDQKNNIKSVARQVGVSANQINFNHLETLSDEELLAQKKILYKINADWMKDTSPIMGAIRFASGSAKEFASVIRRLYAINAELDRRNIPQNKDEGGIRRSIAPISKRYPHKKERVKPRSEVRKRISEDELGILIKNNPWIRSEIAKRTDLTQNLIRKLAKDENPEVRIAIAERSDLSEDVFKKLASDKNPKVREIIQNKSN